MRHERLDRAHQRYVVEDGAILGVIEDVRDLVREEADVDGVQHRADHRHRIVELEMAVAVPR